MSTPADALSDYVDRYLHQLLTPMQHADFERELKTDRALQVALEEGRARFARLQGRPQPAVTDALVEHTLTQINAAPSTAERPWTRLVWRAVFAGAAAAAVLIGLYHWSADRVQAAPANLIVHGQNELRAGTTGSLRVQLVDTAQNLPLGGVPVRIELAQGEQRAVLAEVNTDSAGRAAPSFAVPDWADGTANLRVVAAVPRAPIEQIDQTITLKRPFKLLLSTDKPVYQPGQVIHLRTLALRTGSQKPVANEPATFTLKDPKGNLIFKQTPTTSPYGIAAANCPLAVEILDGAYTVACQVGSVRSEQTVEVKRYTLPKFKVALTPDRAFYLANGELKLNIQADYFFGQPVSKGRAQVFAVLEAGVHERKEATVELDAKGQGTFTWRLPKAVQMGEVQLIAVVTDAAGQEVRAAVKRLVADTPVRVELIPESGTLVEGMAARVFVFTLAPDGTPLSATVRIGQAADDAVPTEIKTTANGLGAFEWTGVGGQQLWWLTVLDAGGQVLVQQQRQVRVTNTGFVVRPDKAIYTGGETLKLVVLGTGTEPVFVDFVKDRQIVRSATVEMPGGRGELAYDLPTDWAGTLELIAYRLDSGTPLRQTRVLYLRPAGQLKVTTTLDQSEYRPGTTAKVRFTLTDAAGQPAPGALSLAAVDEAVFNVLEQRPGLEQTFFTLEQELLKPIYTLYPWAPDAPPQAPELEQGLFARTAQPFWDGMTRTVNQTGLAVRRLHTLTGSTLPAKTQAAAQQRERGLANARSAWWLWFGVCLLAGAIAVAPAIVGFVADHQRLVLIAAGGVGLVVILGVMVILTLGTAAKSTFMNVASSIGAPAAKSDAARMATKSEPRGAAGDKAKAGAEPPRVRTLFPETLLWRPELITDDRGQATLDLELADSITSWRLTAGAVTLNGQLGGNVTPIKVFQPFFVDLNLPVALVRGDEITLPIILYNYLPQEQTIRLEIKAADWYERMSGDLLQNVRLPANAVQKVEFRIRAKTVGTQSLEVTATAGPVGDAIRRDVDVVPDGQRVEQVVNGTLATPVETMLTLPANHIPGSARTTLKLYPTGFSTLVEGLDNIFQMPYGCFEQTSSTTYPNVLALDYLKRTQKSVPSIEAKARQYIHLGYQRLLSFEVAGGGFEWFGRAPAHRTLTAYGLMEFVDMARVHEVDPAVIDRTRRWLLSQRQADGTWLPEKRGLHDAPARREFATLSTTAYIAWAVFAGQPVARVGMPTPPRPPRPPQPTQAVGTPDDPTYRYLTSHDPAAIADAYTLALVANAIAVIDSKSAARYRDELVQRKKSTADGKQVWWEPAARTTFYGAGRSGQVEATAVAVLALATDPAHAGTVRPALAWIAAQKDAAGTWHSTQATVLALQALLAGTAVAAQGEQPRTIELLVDGKLAQSIKLAPDQAEVLTQIDVTPFLPGAQHAVTLRELSNTGTNFSLTQRYHVPEIVQPQPAAAPMALTLTFDRQEVAVGQTLIGTLTATNQTDRPAPMVMLELPIPAGLTVEAAGFDRLVQTGTIARYQIRPRQVTVYLLGLAPQQPLTLTYTLTGTTPAAVSIPAARVYEYYDPAKEARTPSGRVVVR